MAAQCATDSFSFATKKIGPCLDYQWRNQVQSRKSCGRHLLAASRATVVLSSSQRLLGCVQFFIQSSALLWGSGRLCWSLRLHSRRHFHKPGLAGPLLGRSTHHHQFSWICGLLAPTTTQRPTQDRSCRCHCMDSQNATAVLSSPWRPLVRVQSSIRPALIYGNQP